MYASGFMAPAEAVARAVVQAVEIDSAELLIQPGPGRPLRAVLDCFPSLGPALSRAGGATTSMQKIIEQREAKQAPPRDSRRQHCQLWVQFHPLDGTAFSALA